RAEHLRALPAGAEANATVGRELDPHVVEPQRARDGVLRIGELEEAAVLHEAPGRDTRAEDVGPVLRAELQDVVVCERVHPEPGEHGVQVQPGGVARGAQATLLQCERAGLPGARRVLEVGEAVAVVVDAVAADLGGRRLRREARIGVDTHAADAGVRRTGVEVVAVGGRGAGEAAGAGVIGRTVRTGPRAVLRHVARTGQRTAHGARGEEAVARARVAGPVAGLGDVAHAGRGPADGPRRALRVGRAARARPRAGLRRIADAGR